MSDDRGNRLLIVGASARAAAMSAIRSGFEPWAADRFGDLDLKACAETCLVEDYPAGLERAMADAPLGPWVYTGALENRPELVARISANRQLLGVGAEALRAVRDPFRLAAALAKAGLATPRCALPNSDAPRDGSWLCKPLASAGGHGVRVPDGANLDASEHSYLQQRIEGVSVAAIYVASQRRAQLLGITRQLIGLDWCGLTERAAHRFRYCGSIGPLQLAPALESRFEQLGNVLAGAFDLQGLFGVDAISADGEIWPVEVNPRYTASIEILERALRIRSIALHVAACGGESPPSSPSVQPENERTTCCGKAILFASNDVIVAPRFPDWCANQNRDRHWPAIADIPAAGTIVRSGQPIVTVLADGSDDSTVVAKLKSLANLVTNEINARN
jgi:predicted ATP-grasp superfamily ATP-dependent carboligase